MDDLELAELYPTELAKFPRFAATLRRAKKQKTGKEALKKEMEGSVLRQWQQKVVDDLKIQNNRKVMWVWEATGGIGKTFLAKYITTNLNGFYIQNGKNTDISYAYNYEEYVVLDLTRSQQV